MEVIHIEYPLERPSAGDRKFVMAIGDFDGVHLGHQQVIRTAVETARAKTTDAAIMTFNPHPREVLGIARYSRYLAPLDKKLELMEELGVDTAFVVKFDPSFSRISPADFVEQMLKKLGVDTVVVGFDFTFGHKAQGTVETLKTLCADQIDVIVVEPFNLRGEKVSSTLIREQLHLGDLAKVKMYTGRDYFVTGTVVHGDGRGRQIGFPTANIRLSEPYVLPKNGVYAVRFHCRGHMLRGVMNIGLRPTFYNEPFAEPNLEVHLLDFSGQLYGEEARIEFLRFLRAEQKFPNVDALVQQIRLDVEEAREVPI